MPLTQIPSLQDPPPAPPPTGPDPAQLELYGAEQWESAYSQMHDFPTLLIQAQDDLSRSRKRGLLDIAVRARRASIADSSSAGFCQILVQAFDDDHEAGQ